MTKTPLSKLVGIALPMIVGFLGLQTMNMVDLLTVGRLGAAATGGVGIGTSVFSWLMIFGIGLLMGLDYLVAHAIGAEKVHDAHDYFVQGVLVATALGIPLTGIIVFISHHLDWFKINEEVAREAGPYLNVLAYSMLPNLLFASCRQYLQAMHVVKAPMIVLLIANGVNAIMNYLMVFGHGGFPALGTVGSAWATLGSRIWMLGALGLYLVYWDRKHHDLLRKFPFKYHAEKMRVLLRLGFPSSMQMVFEVGVFALATTLAGRLASDQIAAHNIALNIASIAFMVPLGIGSAAAVLVGQEMGRKDRKAAVANGWRAVVMGVGFMAVSSAIMLIFPEPMLHFYTIDEKVVEVGKQILLLVALFQLADGAQAVLTGALRGVGDTRSAMVANLGGHWLIGLPLGIYCCFYLHMEIRGLWIGLAAGLVAVALALLWRWTQEDRE